MMTDRQAPKASGKAGSFEPPKTSKNDRHGNNSSKKREEPSRHGSMRVDKRVLNRLVKLAKTRERSLILTHDNPDPDAMAAAAGMAFLYEQFADLKDSVLSYGGIIGRAENRALVRHLKLPMIPFSRLKIEDFDLVTLVDTQHAAGNHSLPMSRTPDVVIDHHPLRTGNHGPALRLVSASHGSTSSIVTALIRMAGLEPNPPLATALFYGVKSDTRSLGRDSIPADTEVYRWLFQLSDQTLLSQIEHPQVPISYFQAYHTAFERARVFRNVVMVYLGTVYTPDIVPEIAERLLSLEHARWSVAAGVWEGELFVSVRTNDRRRNAGRQIMELTRDLGGSAGGHGSMAGARIPLDGHGIEAKRLGDEILSRFRRSLGVDKTRGEPIIE